MKRAYEDIDTILKMMTPREEKVIRMRYGLDDHPHTLHEVGRELNVTRKCIIRIEAKALRLLRHSISSVTRGGERNV